MPKTERRSNVRTGRGERGIWQRRFWEHTIRDEEEWIQHMDYIHYNPVKHGYVHCATEWPYSSFHSCVQKGWYAEDWGCSEPETIKSVDFE